MYALALSSLLSGVVVYLFARFMKPRTPFYLYLDDEREPPEYLHVGNTLILRNHWVVARSSGEAVRYVRKYGQPAFMSLDHDLGGDDTTMKFLHWYADQNYTPTDYIVHSANPVGRDNIISYMESWKRWHSQHSQQF